MTQPSTSEVDSDYQLMKNLPPQPEQDFLGNTLVPTGALAEALDAYLVNLEVLHDQSAAGEQANWHPVKLVEHLDYVLSRLDSVWQLNHDAYFDSWEAVVDRLWVEVVDDQEGLICLDQCVDVLNQGETDPEKLAAALRSACAAHPFDAVLVAADLATMSSLLDVDDPRESAEIRLFRRAVLEIVELYQRAGADLAALIEEIGGLTEPCDVKLRTSVTDRVHLLRIKLDECTFILNKSLALRSRLTAGRTKLNDYVTVLNACFGELKVFSTSKTTWDTLPKDIHDLVFADIGNRTLEDRYQRDLERLAARLDQQRKDDDTLEEYLVTGLNRAELEPFDQQLSAMLRQLIGELRHGRMGRPGPWLDRLLVKIFAMIEQVRRVIKLFVGDAGNVLALTEREAGNIRYGLQQMDEAEKQ